MVEPLRHRQTKGAATDMFYLTPPRHISTLQILLQKSAYRRRGTAGAFFEAIHCHPLDCAGDLRSTLLTLATLTQRTKGRTVVAGRPTWQACGGCAIAANVNSNWA